MIRFRYFGDSEKAKELVHFGRKQMNVLREQLSLSTIWTDVRRFFDRKSGVEIICSIVSGMEQVDIYVPPPPAPLVKAKEIHKLYLIIAVGYYDGLTRNYWTGLFTDMPYSSDSFHGVYYSVWDVMGEEIVAGPGDLGTLNNFFSDKPSVDITTVVHKALIHGADNSVGNALAYIGAARLEPSDLVCNLYVPGNERVAAGPGYASTDFIHEREAEADNILADDDVEIIHLPDEIIDTASMYWHGTNVHTHSTELAACDAGRNVFGNAASSYSLLEKRDYDIKVTGYGMKSPVGLLEWDITDEYILQYGYQHALTIPGTSLHFVNEDRVLASARFDYDITYESSLVYENCCDAWHYDIRRIITQESNALKYFAVTTPIGELFAETELVVCNGSWIQDYHMDCDRQSYVTLHDPEITITASGEYKDIGMYSSDCEAIEGEGTKVEFYFSQYNTYGYPITDSTGGNLGSLCPEHSSLTPNKIEWQDIADYDNWGDRNYDVVAGVDGVKHDGLTQAFKDLVDYYYDELLYDEAHVPSSLKETNPLWNEEHVPSNFLANKLCIDCTLVK